mmetsp:Transcript_19222/g.29467  ORF Transcript_19222/g.29467 Transcript_19222/m.29467 type:complete len:120 (-) Transcript_19222:681-1040(-)
MSENIESKAVRKGRAAKNQSVKGEDKGGQAVSNIARNGQKFEQQDSSVTACSNFAVIREKVKLSNDSKHIQQFKDVYDALYSRFHSQLMEEYAKTNKGYIEGFSNNLKDNINEKEENIQ